MTAYVLQLDRIVVVRGVEEDDRTRAPIPQLGLVLVPSLSSFGSQLDSANLLKADADLP